MILTVNRDLFKQQEPAGVVQWRHTLFCVRQERNLFQIIDKLQSSKVYVKRGERERGMSTCKWEDNIEMNLKE